MSALDGGFLNADMQLMCMKKYGGDMDEVTIPERVSMRSDSKYIFRRNIDSIIIDALIIDALIIPNYVDLKCITYITITYNGQDVYNIPFELISSLCPHKIQKDRTIISLSSVLGKKRKFLCQCYLSSKYR